MGLLGICRFGEAGLALTRSRRGRQVPCGRSREDSDKSYILGGAGETLERGAVRGIRVGRNWLSVERK